MSDRFSFNDLGFLQDERYDPPKTVIEAWSAGRPIPVEIDDDVLEMLNNDLLAGAAEDAMRDAERMRLRSEGFEKDAHLAVELLRLILDECDYVQGGHYETARVWLEGRRVTA